MVTFRRIVLALAVVQTVFAVLLALAGSFADGGTAFERLVLVLLHPLAAAGLLTLMFLPRTATVLALAVAILLIATVAADLYLVWSISQGTIKGDWEIAAVLAVIPAIGAVYALLLVVARPTPAR